MSTSLFQEALVKAINTRELHPIVQVSLPLGDVPPPGGEVRVSSIAMSYQLYAKNYRAAATVTIGDPNGSDSPPAEATVHGVFSGLTNDSVSGVTNSSGQVTLTSSSTRKGGTWQFCVTDVVRAGWTWGGENHG